MKIKINGLSYTIENKPILKNICLEFENKGIIGILGPNGSGKTSLLKHIYKNIPVQNKIFLDEKDIFTIPCKLYAQKISVLPQFTEQMDKRILVKDIVLAGRYPHKKFFEKYGKADEQVIKNILNKLDMLWAMERKFHTLSGGERQRVMTAKVFASEPEVVVLDEPINHLDIKYKIEFMELLKKFKGLVILSMHDLDLCVKYCTAAVFLKDGEIAYSGEPKKIITEETLQDIFDTPFKILKDPEFIIYI